MTVYIYKTTTFVTVFETTDYNKHGWHICNGRPSAGYGLQWTLWVFGKHGGGLFRVGKHRGSSGSINTINHRSKLIQQS